MGLHISLIMTILKLDYRSYPRLGSHLQFLVNNIITFHKCEIQLTARNVVQNEHLSTTYNPCVHKITKIPSHS